MLRFAGSNTIGSEVLPALAEAYLKQQGIGAVKRIPQNDPNELLIENATNPSASTRIRISSHGSSTAFKALLKNSTDIGMTSPDPLCRASCREFPFGERAALDVLGALRNTRRRIVACPHDPP
jgi:phosphate transport system substrate-binding protein